MAKQRGSRISHFAHEAGAECNWSGETELHLLAKEVIEEDRFVEFHYVTFDGNRKDIKVNLTSVKKEASFAGYRPDILAYTEHNELIIVEICVHHACEDEKVQYLKTERINAIEIHLAIEDFKGLPMLTLESVREGLHLAYKRLISIDPLSEVARGLVSVNTGILSTQYSKIKELGGRIKELRGEEDGLRESLQGLGVEYASMVSRAEAFRRKTYEDMRTDPDFKKYDDKRKSLEKKCEWQKSKLKKEYSKARDEYKKKHTIECDRLERIREKKAEEIWQLKRDIKACKEGKASVDEFGGTKWSLERRAKLNKEIAELDEIRNDMYLHGCEGRVQDFIGKITEQYDNKFAELEKCWKEVSALNPKLVKPSFISSTNTSLGKVVPLKGYGDHRG
ncbi:hypothetical protein [Vibrio neonatus]|uniref:hypothetical protein n=1 Tax=Vibrio neonatus TaxID=278860 RepID=UPI0021C41F59|nr:hypothetical protein [Vibrio neonatus]